MTFRGANAVLKLLHTLPRIVTTETGHSLLAMFIRSCFFSRNNSFTFSDSFAGSCSECQGLLAQSFVFFSLTLWVILPSPLALPSISMLMIPKVITAIHLHTCAPDSATSLGA